MLLLTAFIVSIVGLSTASDPPKLFTPPFDKIYHKMGSEALMTCGLKKGSLPLSFKWFKNGQIIQSTDSVSIGTNDFASNLVFKSLSMSDAGEYTCTVSNTFGSDSITIKVIVEGPPQWTTKPIDVLLRPANKGILKCIPTGNPEPTVVWKKQIGSEWVNLFKTRTSFEKISAYEIQSTALDMLDEGLYGCEASNGIKPDLWSEFRVKLSGKLNLISIKWRY